MTEIPEHLLKRSQDRRALLLGENDDDGLLVPPHLVRTRDSRGFRSVVTVGPQSPPGYSRPVEAVVVKNTCGDCRFYDSQRSDKGYCRRMPPTVAGWRQETVWPIVTTEEWCGEHQKEALQ